MSKYGHRTDNWKEAVLNRLGGEEQSERLLRGELMVSELNGRRWHEHGGIIYLPPITSDGTTGPQWIERLKTKNIRLSSYSERVLHSDDFKPTDGVTTDIAVIKGALFENNERTTKRVRALADLLKFTKPNPEAACLIREMFSDEEIEAMGLGWVITMHEPINVSVGSPRLLGASRGVGGRWLNAYYGSPGNGWDSSNGFAFAVSQVSPQN